MIKRFWNVLASAFVVRFAIVMVTFVIEAKTSHFAPTYTDVDYHVFSDAGALLLKGESIYDRSTYRYSPMFAIIASLNTIIHPTLAKHIFGFFDIFIGILMFKILNVINSSSDEGTNTKGIYAIKWLWLFNPIVINISTRGSGDSFPCFFTLLTLYACIKGCNNKRASSNQIASTKRSTNDKEMKREEGYIKGLPRSYGWMKLAPIDLNIIFGGIAHGVAIHLKLYPIIYLFAIVVAFSSSTRKIPKSMTGKIWALITFQGVLWIFMCTLSFMITSTLSYWYFGGEQYVNEALLYHVKRSDHRHNYSLWWFPIYLSSALSSTSSIHSGDGGVSDGRSTSLNGYETLGYTLQCLMSYGVMLPQLLFIVSVSYKLLQPPHPKASASSHNQTSIKQANMKKSSPSSLSSSPPPPPPLPLSRLPLCFFLITFIFVHSNKVLTAQYFIWYLSLFPLIWPYLNLNLTNTGRKKSKWLTLWKNLNYTVFAFLLWILSMLVWLGCAYTLEFLGWNVFTYLWLCSLLFYFSSIHLIVALCWVYEDDDGGEKLEQKSS